MAAANQTRLVSANISWQTNISWPATFTSVKQEPCWPVSQLQTFGIFIMSLYLSKCISGSIVVYRHPTYVCWFAIVCYYVLLLMFAGLLFVRVWRMACRCQRVRNGLLCLHIEPSSHPKATTEVADMEVLPPVCIQASLLDLHTMLKTLFERICMVCIKNT